MAAKESAKVRRALEDEITRAGIEDTRVDFTGCHGFCEQGPIVVVEPEGTFYTHVTVDDAAEIVASHLRDGIPVAMMEALAMGVPVVSTRVSGIPELVSHEETGLLVAEKEVEALTEAIAQLAEDEVLRQRLATNGRSLVAQEFNVRENALQLVTLFRQVISDAQLARI